MSIQNRKSKRKTFNPEDYILPEDLQAAVEVAITLRQPLLLTGEPGTGKTLLAWKLAHDLGQSADSGFDDKPLIFNTKTTSTARDLFYTYDAVSHFQTANIKRKEGEETPKTADFIELQAFGKAIALTNPQEVDITKVNTSLPETPKNSVVLIDEIDKAPRDFTNDILNEIERYAFRIREQDNYEVCMGQSEDAQIVVIMTSNSEKNLPDAFLRRCVFYHIPFPKPELLLEIAKSQLGEHSKYTESALKELISTFGKIRDESVRKAPATAELIGWLRILELQDYLEKDADTQKKLMLQNLSVLVKTKEDLDAIRSFIKTSL